MRLAFRTSFVLSLAALAAEAAPLQVTSVNPSRNTFVPVTSSVAVTFDRAVQTSSITPLSFRVFGRWSGPATGSFSFSGGDRTVTFTPSAPFSAGELVYVYLSHDVRAADLEFLRAAGYTWSFFTRTAPSSFAFNEIDVMSNRDGGSGGPQTRIYGAAAHDLDNDGYLDMTTVNEVSADVRVFLNRGDGTGLYHDFLDPQPIGVEASPNETGDFNADGNADLCIAAVISNSVWVLLGAGDGTFSSVTEIPVGDQPHGVAVLDCDGDGDQDIVNSNNQDDNLSLLVNNGAGVFAPPVYFDSGAFNEYGLAAADMNGDGIGDVVVTCRDGQEIVTMLGNGNGTFTAAGAPQSSGGTTWVVALGDVNGDAILDGALANDGSNNGAILRGLGNGRFAAPVLTFTGAHTASSDLGDLDGDGDMDWLLSSFGGGEWLIYENNGTGSFSLHTVIPAPNNPSCSLLLDFDNDLDLDLALTDEIADIVMLMRNGSATSVPPLDGRPLALLASIPQPARESAVIRFALKEAGPVTLRLYDLAGRELIKEVIDAPAPGVNAFAFDGRTRDGSALPSGTYYYSVEAAGFASTDRLVFVR